MYDKVKQVAVAAFAVIYLFALVSNFLAWVASCLAYKLGSGWLVRGLILPFTWTFRLIWDMLVDVMINIPIRMEQPPPPPPPTYFDQVVSRADWLYAQSVNLTAVQVVAAILLIVIALLLLAKLPWLVRRMMWKLRGIQTSGSYGEAMMVGSKFRAGDIPAGQIAIKAPGFVNSSHIGYGIRVDNVLVTPTHVISGQDQLLLETATSSGTRKLLVSLESVINSRVVNDVSYLTLSQADWTRLGVAKMSVMKSVLAAANQVEITGLCGRSTGTLMRCGMVGMFMYTGSTQPGMSGAAYMSGNQALGIHSGVMMGRNTGVSMALITREMKELFKGESSEGPVEGAAGDVYKSGWNEKDLADMVKKTYQLGAAEYGDDDPFFGKVDSDFYNRNLNLSEEESATLKRVKGDLDKIWLKFRHQGVNETESVVPLVIKSVNNEDNIQIMTVLIEVLARVGKLEERVQMLEALSECHSVDLTEVIQREDPKPEPKPEVVTPVVPPTLPKKVFPCGCGVTCRREDRYINHKAQCKFQGESLGYRDNQKVVKQTPFLEKRSNSRRMRKKTSTKSSNSLVGSQNSTALEVIRSEMREFQNSMLSALKNIAQPIRGQNSAEMPN